MRLRLIYYAAFSLGLATGISYSGEISSSGVDQVTISGDVKRKISRSYAPQMRTLEGVMKNTIEDFRHGLELFIVEDYPQAFILDIENLELQSKMINRLACYTAIKGCAGRILGDDELASFTKNSILRYALGHKYTGSQLAGFFARAAKQETMLNEDESKFLDLLLKNRIISKEENEYEGSNYVLITFTQGLTEKQRNRVLSHEIKHVRYLTDVSYQKFCDDFWNKTMNNNDREFFTEVLSIMGYDRNNLKLMIDEFQAYMLDSFVPFEDYIKYAKNSSNSKGIASYLGKNPNRVIVLRERLKEMLNTYPKKQTSFPSSNSSASSKQEIRIKMDSKN